MIWTKYDPVPDGEAPPRRSAHTACIVDCHYLYVFGGWDGSVEVGDVTRFDLGVWSPPPLPPACLASLSVNVHPTVRHLAETKRWERVTTHGIQPAPRHFHSCIAIGASPVFTGRRELCQSPRHDNPSPSAGRRIYVFGGFDGAIWRNDVVALDVDSHEWLALRPRGPAPGPRASTSAALVGGDKAAFFGGYDGHEFKDVSAHVRVSGLPAEMWPSPPLPPIRIFGYCIRATPCRAPTATSGSASCPPNSRWEALRAPLMRLGLRTAPATPPSQWAVPCSCWAGGIASAASTTSQC